VADCQVITKSVHKGDIDTSPLDAADWRAVTEEWQGFADAIDERRKMGIENRGLCLLLAYSLQSLQDRRPKQ
jgi:hypothetical protein